MDNNWDNREVKNLMSNLYSNEKLNKLIEEGCSYYKKRHIQQINLNSFARLINIESTYLLQILIQEDYRDKVKIQTFYSCYGCGREKIVKKYYKNHVVFSESTCEQCKIWNHEIPSHRILLI